MSEHLSERTYRYNGGHYAAPNGVGDHDFHCPKVGKVCFLPVMLAGMQVGQTCPGCGERLSRPEPPSS